DRLAVVDPAFGESVRRQTARNDRIAAEDPRRVPPIRLVRRRGVRGRDDDLRPRVIAVRIHPRGDVDLDDEAPILEAELSVRPHERPTVVRTDFEIVDSAGADTERCGTTRRV